MNLKVIQKYQSHTSHTSSDEDYFSIIREDVNVAIKALKKEMSYENYQYIR